MEVQLAAIQIGIRNKVSMISISAMPSMPSAQEKGPASGTCSTNCHCGPPIWYFAQSTMPIARLVSVASKAIQRAADALTNRQMMPATIGTASSSDSIGKPAAFMLFYPSPQRQLGSSLFLRLLAQ